jgi:hypothetical protein
MIGESRKEKLLLTIFSKAVTLNQAISTVEFLSYVIQVKLGVSNLVILVRTSFSLYPEIKIILLLSLRYVEFSFNQ